jgi:PAS domain S-box-containing protein
MTVSPVAGHLPYNRSAIFHHGKERKALPNPTPCYRNHIGEYFRRGFTVDHDWRITSFNQAAERITRIPREEALGKHCWEVFRSNMCETDCALRRTMKQGKDFVDTATYIVDSEKRRIPVVVSTSLLKDGGNKVLGGVETFRDMSVVEELRKELDARYQVGDMVSRSPAMHRVFKILPQVAESDSTVLIQGETGTGKELLARALHGLSPRRNKPFVAINCGALPDTLLESELFGYKAGAFTNALKDKPGHLLWPKGGPSCWMKSETSARLFRSDSCACFRKEPFNPWAAPGSTKRMCG